MQITKDLESRLIYGLFFGLITVVFLMTPKLFAIYLALLYIFCLLEIKSVIFSVFRDKALSFSASFLIMFYFLPVLFASYILREYHFLSLLMVVLATIVSDSLAYFTGKKYGKTFIFPKISPKKTLEGTLGGIISTIIFVLIFGLVIFPGHRDIFGILNMLLLGLIIGFGALIGDLMQSSFKRKLNIKDTGSILGSHGGFTDRLDSHSWTIPLTFLYLVYIGYIQISF